MVLLQTILALEEKIPNILSSFPHLQVNKTMCWKTGPELPSVPVMGWDACVCARLLKILAGKMKWKYRLDIVFLLPRSLELKDHLHVKEVSCCFYSVTAFVEQTSYTAELIGPCHRWNHVGGMHLFLLNVLTQRM